MLKIQRQKNRLRERIYAQRIESKQLEHLCASQRQAIIKCLEKANKDKRYISNWRPISLLNFDLKIISKSLATRVKKVLSNLIDAG